MFSRLLLLLCLLITFNGTNLFGQYESLRYQQDTAEINLFKRLGVQNELQFVVKKDIKTNYRMRSFDDSGRVLGSIDYNTRRYYVYDEKEQLTSFLDSALKDDKFIVNEYKFTYYPNGILKSMTMNNASSAFLYNAAKRVNLETQTLSDGMILTCYYAFTPEKKILSIRQFDNTKKLIYQKVNAYSEKGVLLQETEVKYPSESAIDSTITVYQYQGRNQVAKKLIFNFKLFYVKSGRYGEKNRQGTIYTTGTYVFTYDDKQRLKTIEYTDPADKFAYLYKHYEYDELGLRRKEESKEGTADIVTIEYAYKFYPNR